MLTQAQFETVGEIWSCVDQALTNFDASVVFPQHNNAGVGHRRTLSTLVKLGLLKREGNTSRYTIPSWQALFDADREYRLHHNVWG